MNPSSHTPLSINSLHSHLHLFLFQRCLLLQTLVPNLHSHLQVSCHSIYLISLFLDIKLNTLTIKFYYNIRNTDFCIRIVDTITTATIFTCFNTKWKKHMLISININNLWWSCFTFLIVHWNTTQRICVCETW